MGFQSYEYLGCGAVPVGTCPLQVPENPMNSLSVQPHLPQRSQNPFQGTETMAASCTLAADRPCKCFRTTFLYAFQGEHETSFFFSHCCRASQCFTDLRTVIQADKNRIGSTEPPGNMARMLFQAGLKGNSATRTEQSIRPCCQQF